MKTVMKIRLCSVLLILSLIIQMFSVFAFADETADGTVDDTFDETMDE